MVRSRRIIPTKLVNNIGVSNFNIDHLEKLSNKATYKPVLNQVEFHPYLTQLELRNYLYRNGIKWNLGLL